MTEKTSREKIEEGIFSFKQNGFFNNERNLLKELLLSDEIDWNERVIREDEEAYHQDISLLSYLLENIPALNINKSFSVKDELISISEKTNKSLQNLIDCNQDVVSCLISANHIQISKDLRELGVYFFQKTEEDDYLPIEQARYSSQYLEDIRKLNEWFNHVSLHDRDRLRVEGDFLERIKQFHGRSIEQLLLLAESPQMLRKDSVIDLAKVACSLMTSEWDSITVKNLEKRFKTYEKIAKGHGINGFKGLYQHYLNSSYNEGEKPFYKSLFFSKNDVTVVLEKKERLFFHILKFIKPEWINKDNHRCVFDEFRQDTQGIKSYDYGFSKTNVEKEFQKKSLSDLWIPLEKVSDDILKQIEQFNEKPRLSVFAYDGYYHLIKMTINHDYIETKEDAIKYFDKLDFLTRRGTLYVTSTGKVDIVRGTFLGEYLDNTERKLSDFLDNHNELKRLAELSENPSVYYKVLGNMAKEIVMDTVDKLYLDFFIGTKERSEEAIRNSVKIRSDSVLDSKANIKNLDLNKMYKVDDFSRILLILENAGEKEIAQDVINSSLLDLDRVDLLSSLVEERVGKKVEMTSGGLYNLSILVEEQLLERIIPKKEAIKVKPLKF